MKRIILLLMIAFVSFGCKNIFGPDDPPLDPEELHNFKVEYHRPQNSVVNLRLDTFGFFIAYRPDGIKSEEGQRPLKKIDENVFVGDFDNILCSSKEDKRIIDFCVGGRGATGVFVISGEDFVLINKKTGTRYKLTNVIKNPYPNYGEGSTVARCHILHDGSVTSEVQAVIH